ncbi:MAG: hypothetical protein AB7N24_16480 [Dehalococcoidia bacterium]
MLNEIARARTNELLGDTQSIALRSEWEQVNMLERLQRSVTVVRARLGLLPAKITG